MTVTEIIDRLKATKSGAGWTARCPAHEDHKASLSVGRGADGRWLLHCHAGCELAAVVGAVGLTLADLQPERASGRRVVGTYDYRTAAGDLAFQVVRYEPKDFRQRRPDGSGGWLHNTKGIAPLVYRRDEIAGRSTVYVAEGEKDVDRLWTLGLPATCNAAGAGKWRGEHTRHLIDAAVKNVVVLPDNDAPGLAHADAIARSCAAAGLDVKIIVIPAPAKDVSAWLDAGHTRDELAALVTAASVYTLTPEAAAFADVSELPVITTLSTVKRQAVSWVWQRRFARGKLCIVGGEPGEGKSTMLLDVAARITRGDRWPDGGEAPLGSVLLLSAEDGVEDTIAPRLDAAGADDTRVHVLTAIRSLEGSARGIDLGRDLPQVEAAIRHVQPVLVVIDPISAYLPKVDTWRDSEVRSVLAPLASLAERYGCVVVCVMHLTKNASAKILHRLLGSVGFVAAARVVLAVATDPDDAERRLLLPVKNNLAPPADVLAFSRDGDRIVWDSSPVAGVTADSVMTASASDSHERQDAEQFLRDVLAGPEPLLAADVFSAARKNGITDISLKRAKSRLGVRSRLVGFGKDGRWFWSLPMAKAPTAAPESINSPEGITQKMSPSEPLCDQRVSERLTSPSEPLLQNTKETHRETERLISCPTREAHDGRRY